MYAQLSPLVAAQAADSDTPKNLAMSVIVFDPELNNILMQTTSDSLSLENLDCSPDARRRRTKASRAFIAVRTRVNVVWINAFWVVAFVQSVRKWKLPKQEEVCQPMAIDALSSKSTPPISSLFKMSSPMPART